MRNNAKYLASLCIILFIVSMLSFVNTIHAAGFPVHVACESISLGSQGSVTIAGTTYTNGQTGYYVPGQAYSITGNPSSPTPDNWYFGWWVVLYVGSQASYVDNVYSQTTNLHLNSEVYLTAEFHTPLQANSPTSPITWGTKERITGTAGQCDNGEALTVSYYPHGSGMGPKSQNGQPPFGPLPGGGGYLWTTATVASRSWDTGLLNPTLPISLNQQLPQTYDVYAIWGSGGSNERDSNVVSFTLNPATPQMAAPTLTPGTIQLGQSVTVADEIFSAAYVNSNDLAGTLTVQARKQGTTPWIDVASQQFTSNYGYSSIYGQYGDYYDLSTSWTPPEAASFDVRIVYSGNHYFVPINSPSSPLTVSQPTYSVALYAHCNTESADVSVAIAEDSSPTSFSTPHTFTGLTGTHTFTVPSADPSGHQFKQWSTGETTATITVSGGGTHTVYYEQPPPTYQFTVIAHCNTESSDTSVNMVLDDSPPGHPTPYTFTSAIATHKFTVPSTDFGGHPFKQWSTSETTTSITVITAGTYTAYYEQPPPTYQFTIQAYCNTEGAGVGVSIAMDDFPTGYSTPHTFTSLVATHKFTVPDLDLNGHSFKQWNIGETRTSITVNSGTYTAYYEVPPNQPPTADFSFSAPSDSFTPNIIYPQSPARFDASSSHDPDGTITSYSWSFGDGATANGVIVNHPYVSSGPYSVTLTVTDDKGSTRSTSLSIFVNSLTYEVYFEVDYMAGHEPTSSVLQNVHQYFRDNGIYVYFFVDNQIPEKASVSLTEFWQYEAQYNKVWKYDDRAFGSSTPPIAKTRLKEKWIFYGTIDASLGSYGRTFSYPSETDGGNYIFIADQHIADYASENSGRVLKEEVEQVVLMHEIGHSIGISVKDAYHKEVYDDGNPWSLMAMGPTVGQCVMMRYSTLYWGEKNLEYYMISGSSMAVASHSPVNILVTDPMGRRVGFDAGSGTNINEIPNATYTGPGTEPQEIWIFDPLVGNYTIQEFGTGLGLYTMTLESVVNGSIVDAHSWQGSASPGEEHQESLTLDLDGAIILPHNIEITNFTTLKTVWEQNSSLSIDLSIENRGNYTETFNATLYANSSIIAMLTNVTLDPRGRTDFLYEWNTTGFSLGIYTLNAYVEPIPNETDIADNSRSCLITISVLGDITGPDGYPDGKVDVRDVATVARLFGVNYPDHQYNPNCDMNNDLKIDVVDVATVARHFGEHYP